MDSLIKVFRCVLNTDSVTIQAAAGQNDILFRFESPNQDKVADYELKLMNLDQDHLGIPETEYAAVIKMPSAEFQKLVKVCNVVLQLYLLY